MGEALLEPYADIEERIKALFDQAPEGSLEKAAYGRCHSMLVGADMTLRTGLEVRVGQEASGTVPVGSLWQCRFCSTVITELPEPKRSNRFCPQCEELRATEPKAWALASKLMSRIERLEGDESA